MPSTTASRISHSGGVTKTVAPYKTEAGSRQSSLQRSSSRRISKTREYLHRLGEFDAAQSQDVPSNSQSSRSKPGNKSKPATPGVQTGEAVEEKRMRRVRTKPPATFLVKLERAQTQRMIVLGRKRKTLAGAPAEDIEIVGSTGNIYTVTITHEPTCTCPDSRKGNECKHKVYALHTILKAPSKLQYQLALLGSELEEIFTHAPPLPTDLAEDSKGTRKPPDGECPICYMDLDENHNKLVWCRAQCGHNIHKTCFDQWASSQGGREVRCVYCRANWDTDVADIEAIRQAGEQGEDGYTNVASQFGISRARDYSGYYQPWARRHIGSGW